MSKKECSDCSRIYKSQASEGSKNIRNPRHIDSCYVCNSDVCPECLLECVICKHMTCAICMGDKRVCETCLEKADSGFIEEMSTIQKVDCYGCGRLTNPYENDCHVCCAQYCSNCIQSCIRCNINVCDGCQDTVIPELSKDKNFKYMIKNDLCKKCRCCNNCQRITKYSCSECHYKICKKCRIKVNGKRYCNICASEKKLEPKKDEKTAVSKTSTLKNSKNQDTKKKISKSHSLMGEKLKK